MTEEANGSLPEEDRLSPQAALALWYEAERERDRRGRRKGADDPWYRELLKRLAEKEDDDEP